MKPKLISAITYLSPKRDKPIIDWLAQQDNKAEVIREALWTLFQPSTLNGNPDQIPTATTQVTIDPEAIYQVVTQALSDHFDLAVIRQVVEAGVSNALNGLNVAGSPQDDAEDEGQWLEELNDNLMIE